MINDIVIVGGGLCGSRAALALRQKGFEGRVTLVGDENLLPYDRPPLSKQMLVEGGEPAFLAAANTYSDLDLSIVSHTPAAVVDRSRKEVMLADGGALAYDRLLLATGARARTLPGTGHLRRLMTLRTHADAVAIRRGLGPGKRLVVIGGGFIGLEVAASARALGASVTVLEGLSRLMARAVPEEIASVVEARHRGEGVEIVVDAAISAISENGEAITVSLADGRQFVGDIALAGIGAVPNTWLAEECGLDIDNGVAVDMHLATSDPDIFAAGDCCSFPLGIYGGRRVRLESWRSAQNQGTLAASNLLGERRPMNDLPWFWSDQYEMTLQIVGLPEMGRITIRRQVDERSFILFHLDLDGHLVSASGIGPGNAVARDIRLAEMLISANARPPVDALASASVRLKSLIAA